MANADQINLSFRSRSIYLLSFDGSCSGLAAGWLAG